MYQRHMPVVMVPRHRWVPSLSPVSMSGLSDETPGISPYPWAIEDGPPSSDRWERAATVIGVVGGVIGILAAFGVIRVRG